jgi:cytochrome b pre-mRNA-processing protein 3
LRGSGVLLYENIADGLNYAEFFQEFELRDSFNSWFLVTELHVWLLLTRVMQEGANSSEDGRFLRNCIVESMWADVQTRSKKLGSDNPSFTRQQVTILSEQFQASLLAYDEGLSYDDKALASALWRRFFESQCDDFSKLEKLVKYVRRTSHQLDLLTRDQITAFNTKIAWLPLNE